MSAMIIGTVTPDFEYFFKMELSGRFGHKAMGIFLMDIPIAVLLFFLFHQLVKGCMIDHSPGYFRTRLQMLRNFDALDYWSKHYIAFLVCILIGIISHIFWDALTHERDLIVQQLDFFSKPVTISGFPEYPRYSYFQHLSTFFGALAIALVFHFSGKSELEPAHGVVKFWIILFGISALILLARSYTDFDYFGDVVASVIGALFWSFVITSTLYRFKSNGKKENMGTGREAES
jgi:hypothetical protein